MNTVRKGEWLEIHLDAQTLSSYKNDEEYLLGELNVPPALLKKLKRDQGIQRVGERLRVRLFPDETCSFSPEWSELEVLYEDDFCLVVNKAAGTAVHPAREGQGGTLANAVASYYEHTGQMNSVRHIHRLDEDTTGPVLYAKNEFSQLLLDAAMRRKDIERTYTAIVSGRMKQKNGRLCYPIGRDRHHKSRRRVSVTGEQAVTNYEVVESYSQATWVRLRLETGRTHQIRVHLSHIGHPIIGDKLYGDQTELMARQALHGEELIFPHPLSKQQVMVTAPWPGDLKALLEHINTKK